MVTYINIDTILSDPLLLTATALLLVGPLLFLISLWKLIRTPRRKDPLFDEAGAHEEPFFKEDKKAAPVKAAPVKEPEPEEKFEQEPSPLPPPVQADDMEKTVVMPPGLAEVQGQLEIAFSQIKHLNKKVYELENALNSGATPAREPSEPGALTEPPANAADFTQKLLKLAEHVILLEKTVARLTASKSSSESAKVSSVPPEPQPTKPPIMPL